MKALDVAVQSIATQVVDPMERQRYIGLLESMAKDCTSATALWQQVLTQPITPLTEVAVLMNWTGAVIAKKLFDIHLLFRAKMLEITNHRGNLENPVIPSAYYLLKPGEDGTSYAQTAVEQARKVMLALQAHAETIRSTVPKKIALSPVTVKTSSKKSKKSAAKKVAPKVAAKKVVVKKAAAKPVAKKKSAAKKPVAKKTVIAKAVAKKKAAVKKPVLKKAAKKKTKKK